MSALIAGEAPAAQPAPQPPAGVPAAAQPQPAAPVSATEALSRAEKDFQSGLWVDSFVEYGAACLFFARQEEQATFEHNDVQAARYHLHSMACLGEMAWLYRQYPTPAAAAPVLEQIFAASAKLPAVHARALRLWQQIAMDAGDLAQVKRLRLEGRFITDWQVLGPTYPETELETVDELPLAEDLLATINPPIRLKQPSLNLAAEITSRRSLIQWRHLPDIPVDGRLPLHQLVEPLPGRRALVATWLQCRIARDITLRLECNTPLRIYHDYTTVASFNEFTGTVASPVSLVLHLHTGWNRLLIESESPPRSTPAGDAPLRPVSPAGIAPWWLSCRLGDEYDDLVVDAVRDHPIDPDRQPASEDFTADPRTPLTPDLPDFPTLPDDERTWSDLHRDSLIAWIQAANDAAGGSLQARAAVARKVSGYVTVMQDDLRFYSALARLTPPGLDGFRFPMPQSDWLSRIAQRFPGQSTVAIWLATQERLNAGDTNGACALLVPATNASSDTAPTPAGAQPPLPATIKPPTPGDPAGPAGPTPAPAPVAQVVPGAPAEIRQVLAAVLYMRADQINAARPLLTALEANYPVNAERIPAELWYAQARLLFAAGNTDGCRNNLERIPPAGTHYAAMALCAQLFDTRDFGEHRDVGEQRVQSYLTSHPFHAAAWRLLSDLQAADEQWTASAESLRKAQVLQPDDPRQWAVLERRASRANDGDLADRSHAEWLRRREPPPPDWRMPAPAFSLAQLNALIALAENPTPPRPPPAPAGAVTPPVPATPSLPAGSPTAPKPIPDAPSTASQRPKDSPAASDVPAVPFEYVVLLDERTDELAADGSVTSQTEQWLYLRTHRAAKHFQRMRWPANPDAPAERIQLRRFRPSAELTTHAPQRVLEGVTGPDPDQPAEAGARISWLEDLAAGDVLEIRRVHQIPSLSLLAVDYTARVNYGGEVPCLTKRFSLTYPTVREALWRSRGADLDFGSNVDTAASTTRLRWERSGRSDQLPAAAELRVSFPAQHMGVLDYFRSQTASDIFSGEDLQAFVAGVQKSALAKPRASEATARALYDFVHTSIVDPAPAKPLWQLPAGLSSDCFSLRTGNRWERCRLLVKLMRQAGLEAYVYAVRTDSTESPDPRQLRPLLADDFADCVVGWHRPFDPVVWLYPQGRADLDFGQMPPSFADHAVLRLNPRGPILIERLPSARNMTLFGGEDAP